MTELESVSLESSQTEKQTGKRPRWSQGREAGYLRTGDNYKYIT